MYIKKIILENYGCFLDKIEINLEPNKNGIQKDVVFGQYHYRNDNNLFSPLTAIGGANSQGKTTILRAINYLLSFFDKDLIRRIADKFFFETMVDNNLHKLNFLDKINPEVEEFVENQTNYLFLNKSIDYLNKPLESLPNYYFNYKYGLFKQANYLKPSIIGLTFFVEEFNEEAYIELKLENESFDFLLKCSKNNKDAIIEFLMDYKCLLIGASDSNRSYLMQRSNPRSLRLYGVSTNNEINFLNLINIMGEELAINLIKIADPRISDIALQKDGESSTNINSIIYCDGSKVEFQSLSTGTKKFIELFSHFFFIINNFKNNNKFRGALIMIDELENSLHSSLVDFFKIMVRAYSNSFDIQLIFTSHCATTLSNLLSFKQIFLIQNDKYNKKIISRVSTSIKPNDSFYKNYIFKKIGSHPTDSLIEDFVSDLIKFTKKDYK